VQAVNKSGPMCVKYYYNLKGILNLGIFKIIFYNAIFVPVIKAEFSA